MAHPHHHKDIRKRIHLKKQAFPHPKFSIRLLDKTITVLGVVNVFATLPQVFEIWVGKDASGVSVLSWAYYTFFSFMLMLYGVAHKELPIITTYGLSFSLYGIITIGAVIYG